MKRGTIFITTTGEYSDYGIRGVFYARQDFDLNAELETWLSAHPDQRAGHSFEVHDFLADLETRGLVEEANLPVIDLGAYSNPPLNPESPEDNEAPTWLRVCLAHVDCALHPDLGVGCAAAVPRRSIGT